MIEMESLKSKILLVTGFISAFIGYSFWPLLWVDSFYHFMSFAFCCYLTCIYFCLKSLIWRKIAFVIWATAFNALLDEIWGTPTRINFTEYFAFALICIHTFGLKYLRVAFNKL